MESSAKVHRAMEANCGDATDMISQLPDEVLYHMLSFLDVFDAVQASLLSKRWERLCSAIPCLEIDIPDFCHRQNLALSWDLVQRFRDFVSWVLASRTARGMNRLILKCGGFFSREQVFHWICAAASCNVHELILDFNPSEEFSFPYSLVSGQSLQFLKVNLFGHVLQLPRYAGFGLLECLCLVNIRLNDEDLARSFFSGCRSLKKLAISNCTYENLEVLDISSISIGSLSVEDDGEDGGYDKFAFKVSCPKLTVFRYGAPFPRRFILDDMSRLEILHIYPWLFGCGDVEEVASYFCGVLERVPNLIELKLGEALAFNFHKIIDEFQCTLYAFHGLKALSLWITLYDEHIRIVALMLKHSPNLKAFTFHFDEAEEDNADTAKFPGFNEVSCLKSSMNIIQLINFKGEDNEVEFVRILLECGLALKKVVLYSYWKDTRKTNEIAERVMGFPRSSSLVEVVFSDSRSMNSVEHWASV